MESNQIKKIAIKSSRLTESSNLNVRRTDVKIFLFIEEKAVAYKVNKLNLESSCQGFEVISDCFEGSGYQDSVIVFWNTLNLEICGIEKDDDCKEDELDFYQCMLEKHYDTYKREILMLIPMKHVIPVPKLCFSFSFEVVVTDLRHILLI